MSLTIACKLQETEMICCCKCCCSDEDEGQVCVGCDDDEAHGSVCATTNLLILGFIYYYDTRIMRMCGRLDSLIS